MKAEVIAVVSVLFTVSAIAIPISSSIRDTAVKLDNQGDSVKTIDGAHPFPDSWWVSKRDVQPDSVNTIDGAHPFPDSWWVSKKREATKDNVVSPDSAYPSPTEWWNGKRETTTQYINA